MPLDPCKLPPGRRSPSWAQVRSCLAELGGRGASSVEIARWCGLPVDRVRRMLSIASKAQEAELRWVDSERAARWFLIGAARG